jgi:hypothetical protein
MGAYLMAQRRMISLQIVDSDAFLEMPNSTQNLYFHLNMRADDDGFISNPKKIMKITNSSEDDMKILFTKRFILGFDTGIIVIKHWKIHNYIAKDRYKETVYTEEKMKLTIKDNKSYTDCIHDVVKMDTQASKGKESIDKSSIDNIYTLYPSKCPFRNTYLKSSKDKNKIKTLLKTKKEDDLKSLIVNYIANCNNTKTYYKNFSTFLNNLPDFTEVEVKPKYDTQVIVNEVKG